MIRLKSLLSEEAAKTYTTKKSWTLKATKGTFGKQWDVMLQMPAGTVWKQLADNTDSGTRHEVIQTTTPLLIKLSLQDDPKIYKYAKQPVKAVHTMHGILGQFTPEFQIFIPISTELFPAEYSGELRSFGILGGSTFQHIKINSDNNPHAEDLFSNLEHTFIG